MYRPLRIFLGFVFLLFLIDVVLLTIWISITWSALAVVLCALVIWAWYPQRPERGDQVNGWVLGPGWDIANPNHPRVLKSFVLQDKLLNLGFLGLGAPGSGKTVSLSIGFLYYLSVLYASRTSERLGWAYFEGKGDGEIYQQAVACGAEPDYFFSSELPHSDTLNLFEGQSADVVDRWTRLLIPPTSSTSFYSDEQKAVLQTTIPLIKALGDIKGLPVTLRDFYILLRHREAPIRVLTEARALGVDPMLIRMADDYFEADYAQRQQLIKGMLNRLFVFVNGPINDRINATNPTIDLRLAVAQGKRLYFHLPLTEYAFDLAYAISQTTAAIARDRQNDILTVRQPWHQIYDDWGGFFYDGFAKATARGRSAAMPSSFMFQSKGQMDEVSPHFANQIDDTVPTKIFLRVTGAATSTWASQVLGTYSDIQYSVSDRKDDGMDGSALGERETPRVLNHELQGLDDGEAFITSTDRLSGGRASAQHTRVRFPLPVMQIDPSTVNWPRPRIPEPAPGLGLWDEYMSVDMVPPPVDMEPGGDAAVAETPPVSNRGDRQFFSGIDDEIQSW